MLHYVRAVSNITTVVFDADDSLQLIMCGYLVIRLYYNTISIDDIRHVHYLCFSMCLVEGTHREHVIEWRSMHMMLHTSMVH